MINRGTLAKGALSLLDSGWLTFSEVKAGKKCEQVFGLYARSQTQELL